MDASKLTTELLLGRLSLPGNQLESLTFCHSTPEGIEAFLADLPAANPPELLNRLYRAVPEIAALKGSPETRLAMLQLIEPVIFHHTDLLTERLTVTDKTARQLSLALALLKNLAMGYKSLLTDLLAANDAEPGQLATVTRLAIGALSRMLTTSWRCYITPPANAWREIHALYMVARVRGFETLTPFSAQAVNNQSLSPRAAYLRILLVAAADPARFSPRDLKLLLGFLDSHAQFAVLMDDDGEGLFVIDQDSDIGPVQRTRVARAPARAIGLDSAALITHVERYLGPGEINLPPRLMRQLRRYWTSEITRTDEHRADLQQMDAVFGLSRIHRLLSRTARIDDFVTRSHAAAVRSGLHIHAPGDFAPEKIWQDTRENEPVSRGTWLRATRSNPDDPIQFTTNNKAVKEDPVAIHRATRINVSERGTRIELPSPPDNLSPGELVALRGADSDAWRLGLVRWTRTTANLTRLAGIELLAGAFTPCASALIKEGHRVSAYFPGFLAGTPDSGETLLLPAMPFLEGHEALTLNSQIRARVQLADTLEATQQLSLFRIARLSDD